MNLAQLAPPTDRPSADARIPAWALRPVFVLVAVLLTMVAYGTNGWIGAGFLLAVPVIWAPDYMLAWLVLVFLALGRFEHQATLDWRLLVLIAGVHLLHLIASLILLVPWRSWVEPAAFGRPLARFIAVQIPVQLLAVAAMLLLAPDAHGHRPLTLPEFGIVGAAAIERSVAFLQMACNPR